MRASTGATCLLDLCSTHGIWLCRVHALGRRERPHLNMLQLMQKQATRLLSQQTKKPHEHGAMPLLMRALQGTPSVQLNPIPPKAKTKPSSAHLQRRRGKRLHAHKPLLAHQRLHDVAAALRARHARRVRLRADGQALYLRFDPSLRTFRGRGDLFTAYCILSPALQVGSSAFEQRVKNHPQTEEGHNRLSSAAPHALTGTPLCPPRCVRARQSGPAPHTRQRWRSACHRRS